MPLFQYVSKQSHSDYKNNDKCPEPDNGFGTSVIRRLAIKKWDKGPYQASDSEQGCNPCAGAECTVVAAEPLDLARKIEKAKNLKGPRLILALSPCPPGWDFDPKETVDIGRLAVKTGIWPLKEYVDGKVVHTKIPHPRLPVEEYLKRQGRFAHLFAPKRNDALLKEIQAHVDAYWAGITSTP